MRTGVVPTILDDTYWWNTHDFWRYAVWAAVIYLRAGAERVGTTTEEFARRVEDRLAPGPSSRRE